MKHLEAALYARALVDSLNLPEEFAPPKMLLAKREVPYRGADPQLKYFIETYNAPAQSGQDLLDHYGTMELQVTHEDVEDSVVLARFECIPENNHRKENGSISVTFHPDIAELFDPNNVLVPELAEAVPEELLFLGEIFEHIESGRLVTSSPEDLKLLVELKHATNWVGSTIQSHALFTAQHILPDGSVAQTHTEQDAQGNVTRHIRSQLGQVTLSQSNEGLTMPLEDVDTAYSLLQIIDPSR